MTKVWDGVKYTIYLNSGKKIELTEYELEDLNNEHDRILLSEHLYPVESLVNIMLHKSNEIKDIIKLKELCDFDNLMIQLEEVDDIINHIKSYINEATD